MCMQQGPRAEWMLLGWHSLSTGSQGKPKRAKEALLTQPLRMLSRVSIGWNKRLGKLGSEAALRCLFPEEGLE